MPGCAIFVRPAGEGHRNAETDSVALWRCRGGAGVGKPAARHRSHVAFGVARRSPDPFLRQSGDARRSDNTGLEDKTLSPVVLLRRPLFTAPARRRDGVAVTGSAVWRALCRRGLPVGLNVG